MSETERNEAICVLEKALKERELTYAESVRVKERNEREPEMFTWKWEDGGYWFLVYENSPKYIKELQAAISTLKSQSEAERRVEAVKSTCLLQDPQLVGEEGYEWSDGCTAGRVALSEEILEILEEQQSEK